MPENIVAGLFGLTPYQVQQQRMAQNDQSAMNFAQLNPFQQASYGLQRGAGMLTGVGAEAAGMVDPAVEEAKQRQSALQGIDISNPQSILQRASQIQDPRLKTQLVMLAQQSQSEIDKSNLLKAKTEAALREKKETPSSDMKNAAAIADRKGFIRDTPEWNREFILQMELQRKGRGTKITNILPGEKHAIDIPKFRDQVQQTIKPYITTADAADTSLSMLDLAINQNNPTAYQGSRVQLAKAFGDSNITGAEIKAAGGDPSIWGGLKDATSTLFTGTPSKDTMFAMKRTLSALKKVAESKGKKEIDIQKKIGLNSGLKESDIETIFDFPQFNKTASAPVTETRTLSNGKKVTVTVNQ